jgi:uncharacterized membrane protein
MTSVLLVKVFEQENRAKEATHALKQAHKAKGLPIHNIAILSKDSHGRIHIKETEDVDGSHGGVFGAIVGGLIGLLGGPVGFIAGAVIGATAGEVVGELTDLGLSDEYLNELAETLQPGTSALVTLVDQKEQAGTVAAIEDFEGQLLEQVLRDEMLEKLATYSKAHPHAKE